MSSKAKNQATDADIITDNDLFAFLEGADTLPDDSDLWGGSYQMFQWNNEKKMWEFPMKHWGGTVIEAEYPPLEVDHRESVELSSLIDTIHLSVIAWRVTWEKKGEDGKMIYASQPTEGEKWSKRYNFLVLVKEAASDEPAVLTMRGFTGQYFQSGYEQARRRTLKMARQATKRSYPGYLFWTPMAAGEKIIAGSEPGKRSPIYPPAPVVTEELTNLDSQGVAAVLRALYIGDHLKSVIADYLFNEAEQWASETRALGAGSNTPQLPAPAITVLPGGVLYFDDSLADKEPTAWIEAAMTIPGLFNERTHASNAFGKMLRTRGRSGDSRANQWEAWREELEKRYIEMLDRESSIDTERMLQAGG